MVQKTSTAGSVWSAKRRLNMYIVFLMSLVSASLILMGRRALGVTATLVTVVTLAVMLYLDMTTKLQISL